MRFNMLGSGGVFAPPRAGCQCGVCEEARKRGIPYARTGSSLYNYDAQLLFDTPEELRMQLNRENIYDVRHVILTHWHPDHTQGIRMLEHLSADPSAHEPIHVYIAGHQLETARKLTCGSMLDFYENKGLIKLHDFEETMDFGPVSVKPFYIQQTKGYYFLITDGAKVLLYAPCEYHGLQVDPSIRHVDVFIPHHLYFEDASISDVDYSDEEDSFEKMLSDAEKMGAQRVVVTHIEEVFGLNHDELNSLIKEQFPAQNIEFGYDGMRLDI